MITSAEMLLIIKFETYSNVVYFPKPRNPEYKKVFVQRYRSLWGNEVYFGFENMLWWNICRTQ